MKSISRPNWDNYLMNISLAVRNRANCVGTKVGALIAIQERIISTGYNGTPIGTTNCDQGGCDRCNERELYGKGKGYDVCICVHAEQNTILSAAKFDSKAGSAPWSVSLAPTSILQFSPSSEKTEEISPLPPGPGKLPYIR